MGEAIAKRMVAAACVLIGGSCVSAQSTEPKPSELVPTTKMRSFKPQVGAAGSGTRTTPQLPPFTGGASRATTLADGPSTDSLGAGQRENRWSPNLPNQPRMSNMALPSTDPVNGGSNIATVSNTEDTNSVESKLLNRQRELEFEKQRRERARLAQQQAQAAAAQGLGAAQGNSALQGNGGAAPTNTGFIKAPTGISLPQQDIGTGNASSIAGMFESAGNAAAGALASAAGNATGGAGGNWPLGATGQDRNNASLTSGAGAIGLPTTLTPQLPTNWTQQHFDELISMFDISPTDPKLKDPKFLNQLHERFLEYRDAQTRNNNALAQREAQMRLARENAARERNANGGYALPTTALGNLREPASDTVTAAQSALLGRTDARGIDNRLAARGGERDRFGDPVSLTSGRTATNDGQAFSAESIREEFSRMLDERDQRNAANARNNPYGNQLNPNQYPPNYYPQNQYPQNPYGMYAGAPNQSNGGGFVPPGFVAQNQKPPMGDVGNKSSESAPVSASDRTNQAPDHASLSPGADVRNFSPLVNVLLLCSVIFNLFLWKYMQFLRYNYRDVTVANRLSANGFGD
ncbi:MAG: hypothetical protein AAFX06_27625 [Planctomycetota bacterium]